MEDSILENFRTHLADNYPELVSVHTKGHSLRGFMAEQTDAIRPLMERLSRDGLPDFLVRLICHSKLIQGLGPSRANYIRVILEIHFPVENLKMKMLGVQTFEIVNIVELCIPVFLAHRFKEQNQQSKSLEAEIVNHVKDYLKQTGLTR